MDQKPLFLEISPSSGVLFTKKPLLMRRREGLNFFMPRKLGSQAIIFTCTLRWQCAFKALSTLNRFSLEKHSSDYLRGNWTPLKRQLCRFGVYGCEQWLLRTNDAIPRLNNRGTFHYYACVRPDPHRLFRSIGVEGNILVRFWHADFWNVLCGDCEWALVVRRW